MQLLSSELNAALGGEDLFKVVDSLKGTIYRQMADRKTLKVIVGGEPYFVKIHYGVGWAEIFKNLLTLKLPVLGAINEWKAITKLEKGGLKTMQIAGYGSYGLNPATIKSFIITKEISNTISLEDLFLKQPVPFPLKLRLVNEVSSMVKLLHREGVNHRDLYICHFLMDLSSMQTSRPMLFLIDLHRAQIRHQVPRRWLVKDVGALFFSIFDTTIDLKDLYRFMKIYSGKSLRKTFEEDMVFWCQVMKRAHSLYLQDHDELPAWINKLEQRN